ncbi:hypothetical protein AB0H71_22575 [Nocardia sp. NPDC050697]|uniref:hypothetical protein n=1 Tax=Nocardia sp. NPDC050697 TaxID=3155158 RepID=UPI0033E2B172
MSDLLLLFDELDEPVPAPAGEWCLRYDADGRAVICHRDGAVTWAAGAAGSLRLETHGVFAVRAGGAVVWRADLPVRSYSSFRVTDSGDGMLHDGERAVYSLLHGPIDAEPREDPVHAAEVRLAALDEDR